ncbi:MULTISPECIES: ABC transporter ATP-binding protein [Staphylococcaceae]|uniref:ABC transporter ATP-binding protein n=1 Tax=Staphylococcaceae TaxID=90964 RepID=UPI0018680551|nr:MULTISPECIES: ABC transporter ATP-binding protein [Staphylococcaceae]
MLELKNVHRKFKNGNLESHILKGIDLEVKSGEFLAVMGPSGSGKSTLINILGFIDRNYEGEYHFQNINFKNEKDSNLASIRNTTVGFVFQNFKLIQNNTILENVCVPLEYAGISTGEKKKRAKKALKDVGLVNKDRLIPKNLSGGQQQRVAIARAIVNEPRFIIADEPTGALDSKTSTEIIELFIKLNKQNNTTLILITHDYNVAKKADRIIHILDGIIEKEEVM